jgi:hypothetical protein
MIERVLAKDPEDSSAETSGSLIKEAVSGRAAKTLAT